MTIVGHPVTQNENLVKNSDSACKNYYGYHFWSIYLHFESTKYFRTKHEKLAHFFRDTLYLNELRFIVYCRVLYLFLNDVLILHKEKMALYNISVNSIAASYVICRDGE